MMKLKRYGIILSSLLSTSLNYLNQLQQQAALFEVTLRSLDTRLKLLTLEPLMQFLPLMQKIDDKIAYILKEVLHSLQKKPPMLVEDRDALLRYIDTQLAPDIRALEAVLKQFSTNIQSKDDAKMALYFLRQLDNRYRRTFDRHALLRKTFYETNPDAALRLVPNIMAIMIILATNKITLRPPRHDVFYDSDIDPNQTPDAIQAEAKNKQKQFALFEHPDKLPKTPHVSLQQAIEKYATDQFQVKMNDFDAIAKSEPAAIAVIRKIPKAVNEVVSGLIKSPARYSITTRVVEELEALRKNLYEEVKRARSLLQNLV